jgi:Cu(I)/Ag(I) efflux system membrane fusion protein
MARGLPSGISTVITPTTGIVQQQSAFKGSYVNTGETVFTIANPKYIWARLDGYASDFPWIRLGQEAEFRVDAYPEETFTGKVQYLDPEFDPQTRTFKVGVLYTDPRERLKPKSQ